MCPPAPAQTHRCPKLAFQEKFCTAAFTTPIGPYDHYKRFTHNHERIDINLTAEARHRCLNGDTNVNGLFKLTPFKEKHHRLIASIERRLRWAITEIEEGTGPGNFQEPRLDPAVCAHDPDHRAQSKTSQKTDGVGQTQTQTQISTTCATNNTPITSKVTAAKQTEGRDVATANPSSKVTSHEKLKRTGNLSRPPPPIQRRPSSSRKILAPTLASLVTISNGKSLTRKKQLARRSSRRRAGDHGLVGGNGCSPCR